MLKLFWVHALVCGLLPVFSVPGALGIGVDAFNLAIQHFDPEHEIGLEANGPEARFMSAALRYVREHVPETRSLYNPDAAPRSTVGAPGIANTLMLVNAVSADSENELTAEIKIAIGHRIAAGCLTESRVHEKPFNSGRVHIRKSSFWQLRAECEGRTSEDFCEDREVVDWLCSRGVDGILLTESIFPKRSYAELYIKFNAFVDLVYKAELLQNDPLYGRVFEFHSLEPYVGGRDGDGNSVEVVDHPSYKGFDGVVIRFEYGWGDCPSGCIYKHYWNVYVRVHGESDGQQWQFAIAKVEEGGSPIFEGTRARLRGAVLR